MTDEPGTLTIDVEELRAVIRALLDHVETSGGRLVDLGHDHYWLLESHTTYSEDLHESGIRVGDLGVGQISDDVATVRRLARDLAAGDAFLQPWHDLEHVVGILRAMAWRDLPDGS